MSDEKQSEISALQDKISVELRKSCLINDESAQGLASELMTLFKESNLSVEKQSETVGLFNDAMALQGGILVVLLKAGFSNNRQTQQMACEVMAFLGESSLSVEGLKEIVC